MAVNLSISAGPNRLSWLLNTRRVAGRVPSSIAGVLPELVHLARAAGPSTARATTSNSMSVAERPRIVKPRGMASSRDCRTTPCEIAPCLAEPCTEKRGSSLSVRGAQFAALCAAASRAALHSSTSLSPMRSSIGAPEEGASKL